MLKLVEWILGPWVVKLGVLGGKWSPNHFKIILRMLAIIQIGLIKFKSRIRGLGI